MGRTKNLFMELIQEKEEGFVWLTDEEWEYEIEKKYGKEKSLAKILATHNNDTVIEDKKNE